MENSFNAYDILHSVGEAIITTDMKGNITWMNKVAESLTGYFARDVIGKPPENMFRIVNTGTYEVYDNLTEQVQKTGQVSWQCDNANLVTNNNEVVPIAGNATPLIDSHGSTYGVVIIFHEITGCMYAEEKLRESEARHKQVLDFMQEGCQIIGQDWRYIYLNEVASAHGHRPARDLIGRTMMEAYPGIETTLMFRNLKQCMESRRAMRFDNQFIFPDGSLGWFELSVQPTKEGLFILSSDITERKKADEATRIALAKYITLFENFPLGITVSDKQGNIIETNSIAEKLLGISSEEQLHRQLNGTEWQIIRSDGSLMPTEEYPSVRALHEGRKVDNVEMGIIKPDKSVTWINVTAAPIPLDEYGVVVTYGDINERKQAEEKIINTEKWYRSLIENAPDGVVLIDVNGKFKYASPSVERIFGYTQDDLPYCDADGLTHPEDLPMVLAELKHLIGNPSYIPTIQYRFHHKNGDWRWIESTFSNLLGVSNVEGIIINFRDIHERKLSEAELKKNQDLLKEAQRVGHIGHMEWHGDNEPMVCSDELYRILEMEPQSIPITPSNFSSMLTDEEGQRLVKLDHQFFACRSDVEYEFSIKLPSGRQRWLYLYGNVSYSEDGKPVHMISTIQDITERNLAIEALRGSEEKYHKLFERVNNGYSLNEIITDDKGNPVDYRIVEVNLAFEKIFGKNRIDLINKNGSNFKTKTCEEWDNRLKIIGNAAILGVEGDFEIFEDHSGRYYNVHIYSPSSNFFAAIYEDITDRKTIEGAFKKIEEKYFALFNSKTDITLLTEISDMGVPGRIFEANDQAVSTTGYSREELLCLSIYDLSKYPGSKSEEVAKQLLVGNTAKFNQTVKCKDGREFPVEVMLYKIHSGDKTFALIAAHDITEILKAEKEAEESKRLMNALIDNVPIGITIADSNMDIIWFSQAGNAPPGFNIKNNIKTSVQINPMYYSDTKEPVPYDDLPMVKAVKSGALVENMEVILNNKDGNPVELSCNAVAVKNSDGEIIGGIMTFQDITAIKKREEEISNLNLLLLKKTEDLERSNKELEAFSYSVSHDLRAPLRHISGFSTLLSKKFQDKLDEEGDRYIRQVNDAASLMGSLIDDILKLSRITRTELDIQRVDLSAIMKSISDETQKAFPDRRIEILISDELFADCDESLMTICLKNLFENAWKFTAKNNNAVIEFGKVLHKKKEIYFIRDNGVGFDMKYADNLFSAFQRLHNPTDFEGTGIGLAIVQRVISKHGGRIWAESEENKGATFYFELKG